MLSRLVEKGVQGRLLHCVDRLLTPHLYFAAMNRCFASHKLVLVAKRLVARRADFWGQCQHADRAELQQLKAMKDDIAGIRQKVDDVGSMKDDIKGIKQRLDGVGFMRERSAWQRPMAAASAGRTPYST